VVGGWLGRSVENVMLAAAALLLIAPSGSYAEAAGGAAAKDEPAAAAGGPAPQTTPAPTASASTPVAAAEGMSPDGTVEAGPFEESTAVQGTIEAKLLKGVWLLVANVEITRNKFKNYVQLLKITDGTSGLEVHLLDVRLPESIAKPLKKASQKTLTRWLPSKEMLELLARDWSKLPPAKTKAPDEFLYGRISYTLASSDRYGRAFPKRSEAIDKVLEGSKFGMLIVEDYRPRPRKPGARTSQATRRTSFYGVRSVDKGVLDKDLLKGGTFTTFLAMGAAVPLVFQWPGVFTMYRLAPL
jgi:hypothetical protein